MAAAVRILQRQEWDNSLEDGITNRWQWSWVTDPRHFAETVNDRGEKVEETVGECFRKIDVPGKARCIVCAKDITYAGKGVAHLVEHLRTVSMTLNQ